MVYIDTDRHTDAPMDTPTDTPTDTELYTTLLLTDRHIETDQRVTQMY